MISRMIGAYDSRRCRMGVSCQHAILAGTLEGSISDSDQVVLQKMAISRTGASVAVWGAQGAAKY
jgi:cytoskeletal protein CcmA (bactofilin family)